ncbi:hypothetical protein [Rhodoflexus caldus]|uniref:hypothetical protein n=1 Tax=Rhodoflexus caldus TaxID=2891236 RepID=UPI00202A9659|nr:hypothetical protein [Rhodoflexus caldus]
MKKSLLSLKLMMLMMIGNSCQNSLSELDKEISLSGTTHQVDLLERFSDKSVNNFLRFESIEELK